MLTRFLNFSMVSAEVTGSNTFAALIENDFRDPSRFQSLISLVSSVTNLLPCIPEGNLINFFFQCTTC